MAEFLSPEWITALHEAASSDADLAEATAEMDLILEQHVTDGDDEIAYHIVFDRGSVSIAAGPADSPTVRFRQDRATAEAIALGELSAQRAFMSGRLRIGGDVQALVENSQALAALGDTFESLRASTFGTV